MRCSTRSMRRSIPASESRIATNACACSPICPSRFATRFSSVFPLRDLSSEVPNGVSRPGGDCVFVDLFECVYNRRLEIRMTAAITNLCRHLPDDDGCLVPAQSDGRHAGPSFADSANQTQRRGSWCPPGHRPTFAAHRQHSLSQQPQRGLIRRDDGVDRQSLLVVCIVDSSQCCPHSVDRGIKRRACVV